MTVPWLCLAMTEGYLLYLGQRLIFGEAYTALGKLPAYVLAMPGTVLHELSHFVACKALGVATGQVNLFRPRRAEDGSFTLGYVMHAEAGPLRGALVAIAPLLLVPPLLIGITALFLGAGAVHDLPVAVGGTAPWKTAVWAYVCLSAGQGAFPSTGDHVGFLGFLSLGSLAAAMILIIGVGPLAGLIQALALILALPAAAAGLSLAGLRSVRRGRGR